jgi:hypothetical protein
LLHSKPKKASFDNELLNTFPNVTNVDMSSTLAQIQSVLSQVIGAIQGLFIFTLAAGMAGAFCRHQPQPAQATHERPTGGHAEHWARIRLFGEGWQRTELIL